MPTATISERDSRVFEINNLISKPEFKYIRILLNKLISQESSYIEGKFNNTILEQDLKRINEKIHLRNYLMWLNTDLEKSLKALAEDEDFNFYLDIREQNIVSLVKGKIKCLLTKLWTRLPL